MSNIIAEIGGKEGFILPNGYSWPKDMKLVDGKKEGTVTIEDEDGIVFCILQFQNDMLNGVCEFYNSGAFSEKLTFVNNIAEGWSCEVEMEVEKRWFLYSNGVKKYELKKCDNMMGYWKAVDIATDELISKCQYNKETHKPMGKEYLYQDNHINKIVLYDAEGTKIAILKMFEGDQMTEYDRNGNKVYEGSFIDDILKDYPREGIGKEFANGVLVYSGEWKNGKKEGKGKSFKNRFFEYDGEWRNDLPDGYGLLKKNGQVYKGIWNAGRLKINEEETIDYLSCRIETKRVKKPVRKVTKVIENDSEFVKLLEFEYNVVTELVIDEGCGNEMKGDLVLSQLENLESIVVKKNSWKNVDSLWIHNDPVLKKIEIEGGSGGMIDPSKNTGPFYYVKSVMIESRMIDD